MIRPPRPSEWRACRMLLPESFGAVPPEAFLGWDENAGAIAGLATFHRAGQETVGIQVKVVRPYRRRGIGSLLLRRVLDRSIERGDDRVHAQVDLVAHPEAHAFLTANGFRRGPILREVEGDLTAGRGQLLDLYAGLAASGSIPANARIAGSDEFPRNELERLYRELVVPAFESAPELAGPTVRSATFNAIIVMVGDVPAGMMVCVYNDGSGMGKILATAVAPQFRAWGWANLLLLVEAMERAWESGARRLRFATDESNVNMMRQADRLHSVVVGRRANYVFQLHAPARRAIEPSSIW